MFAALIALIWRTLDFDAVRQFLALFGLNNDIVAAFLPFYVLLSLWLLAWACSYIKKKAEAPGTGAQRLLYFTIASFFIGVVVLLVNPEIKLNFARVFFGERKLENSGALTKWLIGIVAGGLAPFLVPKQLLQLGSKAQHLWQRAVFRFAMFALLVGAPLVVIGLMAMPNISGTASDPNDNLRAGDVYSWPAFAALVGTQSRPLNAAESTQFNTLDRQYIDGVLNRENEWDRGAIAELRRLGQQELQNRVAGFVTSLKRRDELVSSYDRNWWRRLGSLVTWMSSNDNYLRELWHLDRRLDLEKEEITRLFSAYVLDSANFPKALVEPGPLTANVTSLDFMTEGASTEAIQRDSQKSVFDKLLTALKARHDGQPIDPSLNEMIDDARLSHTTVWRDRDIKEFNSSVMRALYPECFYIEGKAYRWLVIAGDEWVRLWAFLISGLIFCAASCCVNLNATSLHRFYRNRLKHTFLVPPDVKTPGAAVTGSTNGKDWEFDLSALDTTSSGAPYHLINAAIDLTRPRFLDDVDAESAKDDIDRRDVQTFIFSQLYCGCTATGWARTKDYENLRADNISLSDAIALSGSAVNPLQARSLGLTMAMMILNLGIGQWMPNPKFRQAPRLPPNLIALWRDWCFKSARESSYCYVSDGGFTDNLGVMSLLKRRCRLIIAVDASCDSQAAFIDLNELTRESRIREGIKILEPIADGDGCEQAIGTSCFDPDENGYCKRHFALAKVVYPDDQEPAWLVYLKPSFTGDEGADLLKFRLQDPAFPNEATSNQFYEPSQVESYRQLGFHITADFCKRLVRASSNFPTAVAELQKELLREQRSLAGEIKLNREFPRRALSLGEKIANALENGADIANASEHATTTANSETEHYVESTESDTVFDMANAVDSLDKALQAIREANQADREPWLSVLRSIEAAKTELEKRVGRVENGDFDSNQKNRDESAGQPTGAVG